MIKLIHLLSSLDIINLNGYKFIYEIKRKDKSLKKLELFTIRLYFKAKF